MVTGVVPSSPRFLPSFFIAHRVQQSLVWEMAEGPRRARIHNLQRRCNTGRCRCSSARRRRRRGWSAKQGRDGHSRPSGRGGSVSCVELLDRGVGCAMGVQPGRLRSPCRPRWTWQKPKAKTVSAAVEIDPRPVQLSVVAMEAETRATNLPWGAERLSILKRGSCVRQS